MRYDETAIGSRAVVQRGGGGVTTCYSAMATIRTALQSLVKKGNMMRSTSEISAIPILLVRPLSTYSALKAPRKIKREPEPVPSWANYDGNRLCEDGE